MPSIEEYCRSCLSENAQLNLFESINADFAIKLSEIFEICTNIKLEPDDNKMPHCLCIECSEKFTTSYALLTQCIEIDQQLRLRFQVYNIDDKSTEDYIPCDISNKYISSNDSIKNKDKPDELEYENLEFLDSDYNEDDKYEIDMRKESIKNYSDDNFRLQMEKNSNKNLTELECNVVKSTIISTENLRNHQQNFTTVRDDVTSSELCGNQLTIDKNSRKKSHEIKTGKSMSTFECIICNKSFRSKSKLNLHKNTHENEKKYQCDICDKRFLRVDGKRIHMRTHTGLKPYSCSICMKSFTQSNSLKTHMTLHTGKTIPCPTCGKLFSRRSNLIVHNREHTGIKPYFCEICSKSFFQKCHLDTHKLSHDNNRQFHCKICGKRYIQKSTLNTHMFSHNGRPIKCSFPYCTSTFVKKSLLNSHIKSVHGINVKEICNDGLHKSKSIEPLDSESDIAVS